MLVFEISNGKEKIEFKIPESAKEVNCKQLIQFQEEVASTKPETMTEFQRILTKEDREQWQKDNYNQEVSLSWLSYNIRELKFWTGLTEQQIALIPMQSESGLSFANVQSILQVVMNPKIEEQSSFKFGGQEFFAPEKPINLMNDKFDDPLRNVTLGEYATAFELLRSFEKLRSGSIKGVIHAIAVLCRKKNEDFPLTPEEQTKFIHNRVKMFENLDYQTAANLGFFLFSHRINWLTDSVSLINQVQEKVEQVKNMVTT